MTTLRILVVDDHEIIRLGVKSLLQSRPGWTVCGETGDGREAIAMAKQLQPDVIIMDITMPELNGLEATRQIREAAPGAEVLVLTVHASEHLAEAALTAGVRGYIMKIDSGKELIDAVQAVAQHKPFLSAQIADRALNSLFKSGLKGRRVPTSGGLTEREREVLQLLAEGKTNQEVASLLDISQKTAETHRANIMRKLQLGSFGELVRYAIRNRLVEP